MAIGTVSNTLFSEMTIPPSPPKKADDHPMYYLQLVCLIEEYSIELSKDIKDPATRNWLLRKVVKMQARHDFVAACKTTALMDDLVMRTDALFSASSRSTSKVMRQEFYQRGLRLLKGLKKENCLSARQQQSLHLRKVRAEISLDPQNFPDCESIASKAGIDRENVDIEILFQLAKVEKVAGGPEATTIKHLKNKVKKTNLLKPFFAVRLIAFLGSDNPSIFTRDKTRNAGVLSTKNQFVAMAVNNAAFQAIQYKEHLSLYFKELIPYEMPKSLFKINTEIATEIVKKILDTSHLFKEHDFFFSLNMIMHIKLQSTYNLKENLHISPDVYNIQTIIKQNISSKQRRATAYYYFGKIVQKFWEATIEQSPL